MVRPSTGWLDSSRRRRGRTDRRGNNIAPTTTAQCQSSSPVTPERLCYASRCPNTTKENVELRGISLAPKVDAPEFALLHPSPLRETAVKGSFEIRRRRCSLWRWKGRSEFTLVFLIFLYLSITVLFLFFSNLSSLSLPESARMGRPVSVDESGTKKSPFLFSSTNTSDATNNHVLYVGKFGLGHRLSKLASAYHLAHDPSLCPYLEEFRVDWGSCSEGNSSYNTSQPDVFSYLYGSNRLTIHCRKRHSITAAQSDKALIIRNDVHGYYAGQSYKNARIPLSREQLQSPQHAWNQKMDFDRLFFQNLLRAFRQHHGKSLADFQSSLEWSKHYVVGLHLRAGNGEKDHFVQADRGQANPTEWALKVASTLQCALSNQSKVLIFVATDTPELIPVVQGAFPNDRVAVVSFPQKRLGSNEGVSYQKWTEGEQCYDGWRSAMTDMALLATSDLVVAASRSTFTQILPLSQVLPFRAPVIARKNSSPLLRGEKYCEMGNQGSAMTCFRDRQQWLIRHQGERTWRLADGGKCFVNADRSSDEKIVHKLMVHLNDVDANVENDPLRQEAVAFSRDSRTTNNTRFFFGPAFSKKYRGGQNGVFQSDWTWVA